MIAVYPGTLPHFNKVLPGKLFDETQHLELEQRCDQLRSGSIRQFFKEIVEMYGGVHLEDIEGMAGHAVELRTGFT
jgi:hypothetical protein